MWNLKKQNSRKSREGWWLLGAGWGGGNEEKLVKVYKLPIMSPGALMYSVMTTVNYT